jgi:hypothetical protein
MPIKEMAGQKFNRLLVIERAENDKYGNAFWWCLCDCGKKIRISGHSLRNGHTKSCGCLQKEKAAATGNWKNLIDLVPYNKGKRKEYPINYKELKSVWYAMKGRCNNPNEQEYKYYGGRGIKVCNEWQDFTTFYTWAIKEGYKKGLTIDRTNNDLGYMPSNCRFVTRAVQNRNTSRCNKVIDVETGAVYVTAEVARLIGVTRATAAKWYREEGLRYLEQFKERYENIVNYNKGRTRREKIVAQN